MKVYGENKKFNQIQSKILHNYNSNGQNQQNIKVPVAEFSKNQLWQKFIKVFYEIFEKKFAWNESTIQNIKVLFHYFLKDEEFFKCKNLRDDISIPSFQKGLLIIGGYGLGKTDYFKVFEEVFKESSCLRFKYYSSKELVAKYELCQTSFDKEYFFKNFNRKKIFIDDLNSERLASNFGKIDVIEEVLSVRYDKKLTTFASCNYSNSNENVKETLNDLGLRYGARIYDRLFESFNIIEFQGKSFRR